MTTASEAIQRQVTDVLDAVNAQTPAWLPESPSRVAQREHERRLREGLALEIRSRSHVDHGRETVGEDLGILGKGA